MLTIPSLIYSDTCQSKKLRIMRTIRISAHGMNTVEEVHLGRDDACNTNGNHEDINKRRREEVGIKEIMDEVDHEEDIAVDTKEE